MTGKKSNRPTVRVVAAQLAQLREELASVRRQMERGLRFGHVLMTRNQNAIRDISAAVNGLGHVFVRKGSVDAKAVQEARDGYARAEPRPGFRVRIGADLDKYADSTPSVTIDCVARLPLCRAACCRLAYVLGTQDLDEGAIRWEYGDPYVIAKTPSGWCVHLGADRRCGAHERRPLSCRQYDCRGNAEIWIDFDRRIPNPALEELPTLD